MCLAQGPQRSDAGEARTRYPSVSYARKKTAHQSYFKIKQTHPQIFQNILFQYIIKNNVHISIHNTSLGFTKSVKKIKFGVPENFSGVEPVRCYCLDLSPTTPSTSHVKYLHLSIY